MNPTSTLAKPSSDQPQSTQQTHIREQSEYNLLDLHDVVHSASEVIVPFGPIRAFAARHPWASLEHQSFEQVVRQFHDTCDVDLYPSRLMISTAWNNGQIQPQFLDKVLARWLDSQDLELPRAIAESFCRNALMQDHLTFERIDGNALEDLARKLVRFRMQIPEKHTVRVYSQRLERMGNGDMLADLNRHTIKWCKLFLDESQAVWAMPFRENGFYRGWRKLIEHDPALNRDVRERLRTLSGEPDETLETVLKFMNIPDGDVKAYFESHLLALPGWAGVMLWRSQQSIQDSSLLLEYLAVRMALEWALAHPYLPKMEREQRELFDVTPLIAACVEWGDLSVEAWLEASYGELEPRLMLAHCFDEIVRQRLWLEAWEHTYEDELRRTILSRRGAKEKDGQPILAQFVFCIDARSEVVRRKLEESGQFATFGTAGFFGLPIQTRELGSQRSHDSLPVMFRPQFMVEESAATDKAEHYIERKQAVYSLESTFQEMKHNLLSSLLLPEISGPWMGLQTLGRSLAPRKAGHFLRKIRGSWLRKPTTELSLHRTCSCETEMSIGFSEEEQIHFARQALTVMGLTDHFAPLVVICGHGSHSTNNPFASSLDCGACGGASSEFNARVLASLCNLPTVRQGLALEGILIPHDTVFTAAEHVTSLDEIRWVYVPKLSDAAEDAFNQADEMLHEVCQKVSSERFMQLPSLNSRFKHAKTEVERMAEDWSEVRPEWGLARNASFIIGDRKLTQGCDLGSRAFLQTYQWRDDTDGTLLANIIAGPGTVAEWINLQYYASTVAPHYYGSGSKTTQTVTAGIGVMQGNASDLLTGLPWQSVMKSDEEIYHEPLRLLIVVQAPNEYIERLLNVLPEFHQKVRNGWVRLASVDPDGRWESWS